MSLKSKGNTKNELKYHFVFIPKYRKRLLTGKLAKRIEGMIRFACQLHDWEIHEIAIMPDHVHLFIQTYPSNSPSFVMKTIKGGTSKKIREYFPELEECLWNASFWADGYMVRTVGQVNENIVRNYIQNQR